MKMLRTHIARLSRPIVLHGVDVIDPYAQRGVMKPSGFWYEVNKDWRRWCEAESFLDHGFVHNVDLGKTSMLFIDSLAKLDAFHRQFCQGEMHTPDWQAVAELYDGIEIAPYQWKRRLAPGFLWYYGWDCASGVIWRPKGATVTYTGEQWIASKGESLDVEEETRSQEESSSSGSQEAPADQETNTDESSPTSRQ